jgi:hypothetical protein
MTRRSVAQLAAGWLCQTLLKPKGISTLVGAVSEFAIGNWRVARDSSVILFASFHSTSQPKEAMQIRGRTAFCSKS